MSSRATSSAERAKKDWGSGSGGHGRSVADAVLRQPGMTAPPGNAIRVSTNGDMHGVMGDASEDIVGDATEDIMGDATEDIMQ